jgi:hypothetical protein
MIDVTMICCACYDTRRRPFATHPHRNTPPRREESRILGKGSVQQSVSSTRREDERKIEGYLIAYFILK